MSRRMARVGIALVPVVILSAAVRSQGPLSARSAPPGHGSFAAPLLRMATRGTDTVITKALRWRSIGPDHAGRSIAISGVKGQPKVGYAGQTGGGLWKTTDGGQSWANITDGQIHSSSVGAVAVSETDPNIVFIGMGESCIRGDIQPGDGIYKSTDAGKTWTHVGFSNSDAIARIRIHPTN